MEFKEFCVIAMTIKACYPNQNILPTEECIKAWYEMLKDLEYSKLLVVVKRHIQTNSFAPSIADLRAQYSKLVGNPSITESSWGNEWNKICNRKYDKLNSLSRIVLESLGGKSSVEYVLNEHLSNATKMISEFERLYLQYENRYILNHQLSKDVTFEGLKDKSNQSLIEEGVSDYV